MRGPVCRRIPNSDTESEGRVKRMIPKLIDVVALSPTGAILHTIDQKTVWALAYCAALSHNEISKARSLADVVLKEFVEKFGLTE